MAGHCPFTHILEFQVQGEDLEFSLSWLKGHHTRRGKIEIPVNEPNEKVSELTQYCVEKKIELRAIQVRSSNLEDIFLNLTGRSMRDA
jgi:hypothetical protein